MRFGQARRSALSAMTRWTVSKLPSLREVVCEEGDAHVSFFRDKADCSMYYVCQGSVKHHKPCPTGLVFNENENVCDWPENVEECPSA